MEKHFLDDAMTESPGFRDEPWYNPDGDCISCHLANEAFVAERVDELLTIYHSAIDNRPIGFQIKGVAAIIQKFGFEGLDVRYGSSESQVESISIAVLLLAAYEQGPRTVSRRKAYAAVMHQECGTISRADLQPA